MPGKCASLLLAWVALVSPLVSGETLTEHEALALEIFKELIEINTTDSVGDNTRAADAMAARLLAAGYPPEDVQVLAPVPRKGNLVARLRSPVPRGKPILLLAHIDVVEADPADWTVAPFEFLERDGYYYGRGTTDDKDEAAIWIANLIRWKQEGYVPNRDIIVALTADEEGGPHNGVQFLLTEHRELVDVAFVLNEGGGGAMINGQRVANAVQAAEKVFLTYELEVTNRGGHSSLPRKDNAIYELAAALIAVSEHQFPVQLNKVTRAFFRATAGTLSTREGTLMRGLLDNPPNPASVAMVKDVPAYDARLRTTCVATQLDAGHAENALPQRALATVNCRMLPGHAPEAVKAALAKAIDNPNVSITAVSDARPSPPSPLTEEVMAPIMEITEAMWPGVAVMPIMSTGATDGLYFRLAGIPAYGVSGIFGDVDDTRAHGRDERILAEAFFDGLEFLDRLARAYTSD
jgi:acetylornithine deacetylase/succinyl-diaminopimelate desuccinylase-like protein